MTDWYATGKGLGSHVKAIEAGNDLLMPGGKKAARELKKALEEGILEEEDLKRCAGRVLQGIMSSQDLPGLPETKKRRGVITPLL